MLRPQLARGQRRVADALRDELRVPWFADAEAIHGADLHVGDHLRRRHDDGFDIGVGIDAVGGEPIAHPQVMRATRESHRRLGHGALGLLLQEDIAQGAGIGAGLLLGIGVGNRNRLAVEIEAGQNFHRQRHVVLGDLAERHQVGHRRQDMRAIDAVAIAAQHQIVARRAPGRLLQDLDASHAMFLEQALFLGDDQRRGIGERDEAELCGIHFRP